MKYENHPAAEIFPLMTGKPFDELKADIEANKQKEPIVIFEGKILDGRNRYRACQELGFEPLTVERDDIGSPFTFVASANLHRRHLNESQRGMIAAKLSNKTQSRSRNRKNTTIDQEQASELLNISVGSTIRANFILEHGTPEDVAAVDRGEVAVTPMADRVRARAVAEGELLGSHLKGEVYSKRAKLAQKIGPTAAAEKLGISKATVYASIQKARKPTPQDRVLPTPPDKPKSERAEELLRLFGDGKWHSLSKIAQQWGNKTTDAAQSAMRTLGQRDQIRFRKRGPNGVPDAIEYMIHAPHDTALIPISEIREKLLPWLEILQREGVRNPDLADTASMGNAAWRIHWQLDEWAGEKGRSTGWVPGKPPPEVAAADKELVRFPRLVS